MSKRTGKNESGHKPPRQLRVRNWDKFQHYKKRNPPWIKVHIELLGSEDWVMLDDASRLLAIVCMLVASRNEGMVPDNPAYLKRMAYLDKDPDLEPLISCRFLEVLQARAGDAQADARSETEAEAEAEKKDHNQKAGTSKVERMREMVDADGVVHEEPWGGIP